MKHTINKLKSKQMKNYLLIAAAGLCCLAACHSLEPAAGIPDEGSLILSVQGSDGPLTKADANTGPMGNEAAIDSIQTFLFSSDGSLYRRICLRNNQFTESLSRVKTGIYSIVAVANAPALTTITNRSELESTAINLGMNDTQHGFLMFGADTVEVIAGSSAVQSTVTVSRYVGRVRLVSVKNNLPAAYGSLSVDYAFLENAYGRWTYGAQGVPDTYVNLRGRTKSSETVLITESSLAEYPALTFKSLAQNVAAGATGAVNAPFYTLPNRHAAGSDNFTATTSGEHCARLVVHVSYGNQGWYYPVTIGNLERNKTYDVSFSISGPGVSDPDQPVTTGSLSVTVNVDTWKSGGVIEGEF